MTRLHRSFLRMAIGASFLAMFGGAGVLAHEGEEGTPVTAMGDLTVIQADDFVNHRAEWFYRLEDKLSGKSFDLHFTGKAPAGLHTGAKVRVHGRARNAEFTLEAGGAGSLEIVQTAAAAAGGEQRTVVLTVNFLDAALECSQASIDGRMFTSAQSVDGLYRESSNGNMSFTGDVFGPYTIDYSSTGKR